VTSAEHRRDRIYAGGIVVIAVALAAGIVIWG
jgi:hypothetical protein